MFELDHHKYTLLLTHAVVCAFSFIEPGDHLPAYLFTGKKDEGDFKIQQYTVTHRYYSRVAWMGRNN